MRTYTILFSIAAHTLAVLSFVVITVSATDVLPEPRRAFEILVVRPALPKAPPPARRSGQPMPRASADAAPLQAPDAVRPESGADVIAEPPSSLDGVVIGDSAALIPAEPPPPPPTPATSVAPMRVGGAVRPPQKIHDVPPVYPPIAQSARVGGVVILEAVIAEDGSVRDVHVLRSIPLLDQAAIDAVRQWRFTPTLLNGQPVPIVMTVTVRFDLR